MTVKHLTALVTMTDCTFYAFLLLRLLNLVALASVVPPNEPECILSALVRPETRRRHLARLNLMPVVPSATERTLWYLWLLHGCDIDPRRGTAVKKSISQTRLYVLKEMLSR